MTFWIIIALIIVAVAAILARAARQRPVQEVVPAAYDLQVYRDQLKDVERDVARGVISPEEAERVRIEVSRRILAADAKLAEGGNDTPHPGQSSVIVGAVALVALLGGSVMLYQQLGAPGYGDVPIEARLERSEELRQNRMSQLEAQQQLPAPALTEEPSAEFLTLMERLRQTMKTRPNDLQGLSLLARNEAALGNHDAAIDAQRRIIGVRGGEADAADYTYLAELQIGAVSGYVSQEAEAALRKALSLDPRYPFARYYLSQYLMQVDRPDAAFRTLEGLIREGPAQAPWVQAAKAQIEEVAWHAGVNYDLPAETAAPGPNADDIAAAEDMTAEERQQMIRGMVDNLSARLTSEGGTPEDWVRLIRAQSVLGEIAVARTTLEEAKSAFWDDTEAQRLLDEAARDAGLAE